MTTKCQIVTADWKELTPKVVKDLKKALKVFNVKLFDIDTSGDWYALAICDSKATKKDAEVAFDKWCSK
ncbi:hypothetical protein MUP77_16360 [Candidatus Bathyarchaeota archaeon]|nr:hypothetical protein [Candidatus Bathyarchaeota archaeon]